jgi:hypothetical protein
MSTQKPQPKKKSQSPSKKVAKKATSGSSAKNTAVSEPSAKKKPGPKKGAAKKAQPEKKAAAIKATAKKKPTSNSADYPKKKVGRPPHSSMAPKANLNSAQFGKNVTPGAHDELAAIANKYKEQIETGSLRFADEVKTAVNTYPAKIEIHNSWSTPDVNAIVKAVAPNVSAKKKNVVSRFFSWFKPSKRSKKK